ncbi:hypothetical protein COLO4_02559 [Corchorus olitorius]|uniref:Uncharacterized protein n=1 Tax=Corchorus olitorius TaxID=93759 RepID=A0A1R3L0Q6_9ROSI|nr:hypothetical protein COLO4_02559 [Corchorus olitorius]
MALDALRKQWRGQDKARASFVPMDDAMDRRLRSRRPIAAKHSASKSTTEYRSTNVAAQMGTLGTPASIRSAHCPERHGSD